MYEETQKFKSEKKKKETQIHLEDDNHDPYDIRTTNRKLKCIIQRIVSHKKNSCGLTIERWPWGAHVRQELT